ncbi:hypothetical protein N7494_001635 [Penicillium frequentans]|uniref:Major facilitator superfamily (MFS) profile domain-containing protein n=1 Tax=Penicillium frequentans TaxID=3151616 RepID=A0AAD6D243_9EURO|nr:hypothetical protein N7494_001635 [Penicillium glabrum]
MITSAWGQSWRSSTWFTITAMVAALFTDTFLASFIVPILPYMLEVRIGLDPSRTQRTISWLLAENAAVDVIVRIPLAHFADKSTSTRGWLLSALGIIMINTAATAAGLYLADEAQVPILFITQSVQAVASSIMWVAGYTTVAKVTSLENTAKTYALISMASCLGYSTGPMVSGTLLQLKGYWVAWTSAFLLLGIDMAFRLLMVEKKREEIDTTGDSITEQDPDSERSALLSTHPDEPETYAAPKTIPNFYRCIFSKVNFVAGVYLSVVFGLLITSFNATIPLHVRDVFGWGGMQSGFMFACLQAPRLAMSPFVGWLKDRFGTRIPTASGFATLAPLFWLLGVPGSAQFPSIDTETWGSTIYVSAMILIGFQTTFLNGSGMIEATVAMSELQKEYPGAFGPNGGKSRAVAIVGVAWTLGACIGPLLGGTLNEKFGYYVMNCVVGKFPLPLKSAHY